MLTDRVSGDNRNEFGKLQEQKKKKKKTGLKKVDKTQHGKQLSPIQVLVSRSWFLLTSLRTWWITMFGPDKTEFD